MITLVTGGARSGKTRQALRSADATKAKTYIATAELLDVEMQQRAVRHRAERGSQWVTIEEPYEIADQLKALDGVVVIDCLTLWLSNWLLRAQHEVQPQIEKLCTALRATKADVIAITNEVGCSIVPDNEVARSFRDHSGLMNQRVADTADRVFLMVCGIPVRVKG
jgi:adenosylcobinamide kinase/adenosylcobinamide-phosphate guanylyltransferase